MTSLLFQFLLWLLNQGSPQQIPERNEAKREAAQAFRQGQYARAAERYQRLAQATFFPEVSVLLNLAHSYFLLNDTAQARRYYGRLFRVSDPRLASLARSQVAVLVAGTGDTAQALTHLRQALTLHPDNETARYNYELLRRRYRPQPKPPNPTAPPPTPSEAPVPPPRQEVLPSEQRRQTLNRLQRFNFSEAQAQQLLDALQATHRPYLQQQRRAAAPGREVEKPW